MEEEAAAEEANELTEVHRVGILAGEMVLDTEGNQVGIPPSGQRPYIRWSCVGEQSGVLGV